MQDAAKIQQQIDYQTTHQNAKAEVLQGQLASVQRNRLMAERELAKFRVLREGFNVAKGALNQQYQQIQARTPPNPESLIAFEGALGRLDDLIKQTDMAIAKNEGTFMAFQAMEQQFAQQVQEANARQRAVQAQGAKAVELASRVGNPNTTVTGEIQSQPTASMEDLIGSVESAPPPSTGKGSGKRGRPKKKR